jgi:hypothetical protein
LLRVLCLTIQLLTQGRYSNAAEKQRQQFIVYVQDPTAAERSSSSRTSLVERGQTGHEVADADQTKAIHFLDGIAGRLSATCKKDPMLGEVVYLGRYSPANFFRFMHPENASNVLPDKISLESAFALTNRTTLHPFGSLWSTVDVTLADVLKALPAAETCMRWVEAFIAARLLIDKHAS